MRKAVTGELEGHISTDANSAIGVRSCDVDRNGTHNYDMD